MPRRLVFSRKPSPTWLDILDVRPELIAHDLHPDFPSTHLALSMATARGIPALAVGHHQAHIAAIAAEHGIDQPLIGLAIDGTGLGPDGGLWAASCCVSTTRTASNLAICRRSACRGDRAAREPWRMAVSALHGGGPATASAAGWKQHYPQHEAGPLLTMLARNLRCPPTTSLGRWPDAAAGLLGLRAEMAYEGQAAMELEGLAAAYGPVAPAPGGYAMRDGVLDFSPLILLLLNCREPAEGAALFHATVAAGLAAWLIAAADARGDDSRCRRWLRPECRADVGTPPSLDAAGLLCEARQAPPNDGGLALGQAWVGRRQMRGMASG